MRQQVQGLGDQGHQVVGAVGQGRVVERAGLLGDPHRVAAHLHHERLGHGAQDPGRGHPERASGQPVEVRPRAREGHHRVQRHGQRPDPGGRFEHAGAVAARGVHEELPRGDRPGVGQPADEVGQHVVGHGEQDEVGRRPSRAAARRSGVPGRNSATRRRERSETAWAPTSGCPARARAAASGAPARPTPITPTASRGACVRSAGDRSALIRWQPATGRGARRPLGLGIGVRGVGGRRYRPAERARGIRPKSAPTPRSDLRAGRPSVRHPSRGSPTPRGLPRLRRRADLRRGPGSGRRPHRRPAASRGRPTQPGKPSPPPAAVQRQPWARSARLASHAHRAGEDHQVDRIGRDRQRRSGPGRCPRASGCGR